MIAFSFSRSLVIAAAALAVTSVQAAPIVFFGENQTPGGLVAGAPLTARTAFLSNLTSNVGNEGFESFTVSGVAPLSLAFTGSGSTLNATLTGDGEVRDSSTAGRFNTTAGGKNFWSATGSSFTIDFDTAIAAFGFYGTDIGDFNGQVTLALTDINNVVTNLTVNNTVNGANASLLFFGFIDTATTYKRIVFGNTGAGVDVFGFDDVVIGDLQQVAQQVPAPATLGLMGIGLLGLAALRRRKPV